MTSRGRTRALVCVPARAPTEARPERPRHVRTRAIPRLLCVLLLGVLAARTPARDTISVGGKNFTESSVLAALMAQSLTEHTDLVVELRPDLGSTMICWEALKAGEIDLYADYTGTGWAVILGETGRISDPLRTFLHVQDRYRELHDIEWLAPFGLNNTYALALREDRAAELGIERISDLVEHGDTLSAGFSIEFMNRDDGWPGLAAAYGLELASVRSLEHGLAYTAVRNEAVDLIDAYSTDGKLLAAGLRVLEDDRGFFPPYNAAPIVRGATLRAHPELAAALAPLAFRLLDATMQALNFLVDERGHSAGDVARAWLELEGLVDGRREDVGPTREALVELLAAGAPDAATEDDAGQGRRLQVQLARLGARTLEHLLLTFAAVLLAALVAIPLGIATTRRPGLARVALGTAGVIQTIPSLALLAFMIPVLGLGPETAVAALFLYALLPILRNTDTGIREVDPALVDAARGMGLSDGQVLRLVELPLARRTILAGLRTSTVISIGVATLAAFIGAGGLGEPIVTGLYLNDTTLILSGAVPAALLAVLADLALGRLEIRLDPRARARGTS